MRVKTGLVLLPSSAACGHLGLQWPKCWRSHLERSSEISRCVRYAANYVLLFKYVLAKFACDGRK